MVSPWKRALSMVITSLVTAFGLAFIFPIIFGPMVITHYRNTAPPVHRVVEKQDASRSHQTAAVDEVRP